MMMMNDGACLKRRPKMSEKTIFKRFFATLHGHYITSRSRSISNESKER